MGLHLIAAVSDPTWLDTALNILKVVIGLGFVIFVHELGHFAVAKFCGVKCEKFYIGFDFFGLKLWKRQYGETEYGIGVFPLGGYVKMLGQEDNPARLREEFERAKAAQAAQAEGGEGEGEQPEGEPVDLAAVEAALYDPRSYLAQSVPKRMAIISAGVIMNVIFAFLMAVVGYALGVREVACGVGEVVPGKAAWKTNMVSGDQIIEIAGEPVDRYQDLMAGVALGDVDDGITMVLRRPGAEKPYTIHVMPSKKGNRPTIGVGRPDAPQLSEYVPFLPGSAGSKAVPPLEAGDTIVRIGDVEIEDAYQVRRQLVLHMDETLKVTVRRAEKESAEGEGDGSEKKDREKLITVELPPQPMLRLGLVMEPGEITAVQDDSPAAKAGIQAGDRLVSIDKQPPGDPMTLDQRLRARAGETVEVVVQREGKEIASQIELRKVDWFTRSFTPGSPTAIAPLGIALEVTNQVAGIVPGSPADGKGIEPGDRVAAATIYPPEGDALDTPELRNAAKWLSTSVETVDFNNKPNWPHFFAALQSSLPGTTVKLATLRGEEELPVVTLDPAPAEGLFNPLRGLMFEPATFERQAHSLAQAVHYGWDETIDSLTLIWRSLHKVGTGQVSAKEFQGPVGILGLAVHKAAEGTGPLLLFLTMLSANLAVINFLPIPVLDGGHMVFLAYEGITGKPPSERIFLTLSYLGLFFILGLMIWVTGLDIGRLLGR